MTMVSKLDRREFVKLGALAGGGLLLGVRLPERRGDRRDVAAAPLQPNAFVRVAPDGQVTIWLGRADMGQGVRTALPMIVADELDADWSRVTIVQANADPRKYGRMMTVGSSSVRGGAWMSLRQAGATARAMLVAAAAAKWGVDASQLRTAKGRIFHDSSKRSLGYGEVADAAAGLPVPASPRLKDPKDFTLIGTKVPLVDTDERVTGKAAYGIDARVPGMLFATVVHPPVFGDKVKGFDATKAKAVAGVKDVVQLSQGVAVVANSTWAAFKGAKALEVTWEPGGFTLGSAEIAAHFAELAAGPGVPAKQVGSADTALASAAKRVDCNLRCAVPGARDDGADELHRRRARRSMRGVGADAEPAGRAEHHRAPFRSADRQGDGARAVPRLRMGAAVEYRLRAGRRRGVAEDARAGAGAVDTRGGHAARLLPAGVTHRVRGRR